jgi:hypothetical protein
VLRIWITSSPDNMTSTGSWRRDGLFFHSNWCISSSSLESDCARASGFCDFGPDLGLAPASLYVFFSSSVGRI